MPTSTAVVSGSDVPVTPLYKRIAERLRARIAAGELRPGDQLPSQREIAEEWQCSLQPIKWALRELELAGVIETRQGVGSFVVDQQSQ